MKSYYIVRIFVLTYLVGWSYCFALSFSLATGGRGDSIDEIRLKKMPVPDIKVFRNKSELKHCKVIAPFKVTAHKEFWNTSQDVCDKMIKRLKKMTFIEKGDSLYFKIDHRGCPNGVTAVSYKCKK